MEDKIYMIAEAADRLHLSKRSIRQMCRDRKLLGAYKLPEGRKWLIPESAIERFEKEGGRLQTQEHVDRGLEQALAQAESDGRIGGRQIPIEGIDPLIAKAREEHLAEVRGLIEEWKEALPYDAPSIDWIEGGGFGMNSLPFGMNRVLSNPLFRSLKEHLPSGTLWGKWAEWEDRFSTYIEACQGLIREIRRQPEGWPNVVEVGERFVVPILHRLSARQLWDDPDFFVGWDWNTLPHGGSHQTLFMDEITDGRRGVRYHIIVIPEAANPKDYIKRYEHLWDTLLSAEETVKLNSMQDELCDLQRNILDRLTEILLRRDYLMYRCRLCPGQLSLSQ